MEPAPNAQVARSAYLHIAGPRRVHVFIPVAVRWKDKWELGVITEWIKADDSPWMAHIVHRLRGDHVVFDYLDNGSIVPLEIDLSGDEPVLRRQQRARKPDDCAPVATPDLPVQ